MNMKQLIEVRGHRLRYIEDGVQIFETYCGFGRGGFAPEGEKREGDLRTPCGKFRIESAFGFEKPALCLLPFRKIGPYSYWSGEREDYNRWVEAEAGREMPRSERLADYPLQYRLALVISYNTESPEWGLGSAIFLHCRKLPFWQTAGCISIPEGRMKELLARLRPGAVISIESK